MPAINGQGTGDALRFEFSAVPSREASFVSAVAIPGFDTFDFTHDGHTYDVYRAGTGPAVVVMHEIPGITPEVARFARWVVDAGFTVYMPTVFGVPLKPFSIPYVLDGMVRACISREFATFSQHRSSRIVEWMRALSRRAFADCGGPGVGAVGMCLTGNFALAMMVEPFMMAPVLSQPSLPFPIGASHKRDLGVSDAEIAAAKARIDDGARILGFRFHGDPLCGAERFETLRNTFGDAFEGHELPQSAGDTTNGPKPAHSVLTANLVDEPGSLTKEAVERCLSFFREQLHTRTA